MAVKRIIERPERQYVENDPVDRFNEQVADRINELTGYWLPYDPTDNDATPSVEGKSFLRLNYSNNTTITDFEDGASGQILDILKTGGAGTVTIQDGANIRTNTGANKAMINDIVYRFRMLNNIWYEVE